MMQVQDRQSGEIISQVYNFVDAMQGVSALDVEKFCQSRGIIKNDGNLSAKEQETLNLVNGSSYLNTAHFNSDLLAQNKAEMIDNTEELTIVSLDPNTCDYKKHLISIFREMEDPFGTEIEGVLDYEQNPSDPTKPQKTLTLSAFK